MPDSNPAFPEPRLIVLPVQELLYGRASDVVTTLQEAQHFICEPYRGAVRLPGRWPLLGVKCKDKEGAYSFYLYFIGPA